MTEEQQRRAAIGGGEGSIVTHLCNESVLQDYGTRSASTTDIVLTPEQLHRRNLKRRFAEADQPWGSMRVDSPAELAESVVKSHEGTVAETLDRTDRLRLLEDVLKTTPGDVDRLQMLYGSRLTANADAIEAARAELELLVGSRLDHLSDLHAVCDELDDIAATDAQDYVAGMASLQRVLRAETRGYLSDAALMRAAQDIVEATGGGAWRDTFEAIERVHLAGISTLGTPLLEFLVTIARETDTGVHTYLRAGTGPRIAARLSSRLTLDQPDERATNTYFGNVTPADHLSCPVTEIAAETRHEEARVVMAIVERLLQCDISRSDIAIVARDADAYERALGRAANKYGRHLSVWTQLELKRTLPYRIVVETVQALAAAGSAIDADTMFGPLKLQWVPPDSSPDDEWPLTAASVDELRQAVNTESPCALSEWRERLLAGESLDDNLRAAVLDYLTWFETQPTEPDSNELLTTLSPLIDAFDRVVLPERDADETRPYDETERSARAMQRVAGDDTDEHLLREARAKYDSWLDREHITQSWDGVLEILNVIASTRPGRREHSNAEPIDVLDATDTWMRTYRYVVAVGCVDGEWPQQPYGGCPPELRAAIREGSTAEATQLPVRGAWTTARDRDHFADAVSTPTEHLVLTRFTHDTEGMEYERSPFLDALNPTDLGGNAVRSLVRPETRPPDRIVPEETTLETTPAATDGGSERDRSCPTRTTDRGDARE